MHTWWVPHHRSKESMARGMMVMAAVTIHGIRNTISTGNRIAPASAAMPPVSKQGEAETDRDWANAQISSQVA